MTRVRHSITEVRQDSGVCMSSCVIFIPTRWVDAVILHYCSAEDFQDTPASCPSLDRAISKSSPTIARELGGYAKFIGSARSV